MTICVFFVSKSIRLVLTLSLTLLAGIASAADWSTALTDAELAQRRGGFILDRFEIAIGLEQRVSVNGDLQVINSWRIPDIGDVRRYTQALESMPVLQDIGGGGEGARITSGVLDSGSWLTLIQNNVDGAVIQNMQQLNIELNNLGQNRRLPLSFQDSLLSLPAR